MKQWSGLIAPRGEVWVTLLHKLPVPTNVENLEWPVRKESFSGGRETSLPPEKETDQNPRGVVRQAVEIGSKWTQMTQGVDCYRYPGAPLYVWSTHSPTWWKCCLLMAHPFVFSRTAFHPRLLPYSRLPSFPRNSQYPMIVWWRFTKAWAPFA